MIEDKLHNLGTSSMFPWYVSAESLGFPSLSADIADVIHFAREWSKEYELMMGEEGQAFVNHMTKAGEARIELIRALRRLDEKANFNSSGQQAT